MGLRGGIVEEKKKEVVAQGNTFCQDKSLFIHLLWNFSDTMSPSSEKNIKSSEHVTCQGFKLHFNIVFMSRYRVKVVKNSRTTDLEKENREVHTCLGCTVVVRCNTSTHGYSSEVLHLLQSSS